MTTPAQHRIGRGRIAIGLALCAATIAFLTIAGHGAAPSQAADFKACGTMAKTSLASNRYERIRARGTTCTAARKLIKQWETNRRRQTRGCKSTSFCKVRAFTCKAEKPRAIDFLVDCRRPGARILFTLTGPACAKTRTCKSSTPTAGGGLRV